MLAFSSFLQSSQCRVRTQLNETYSRCHHLFLFFCKVVLQKTIKQPITQLLTNSKPLSSKLDTAKKNPVWNFPVTSPFLQPRSLHVRCHLQHPTFSLTSKGTNHSYPGRRNQQCNITQTATDLNFHCLTNDLLDRWLVACVGRTLGTMGRETAALVSEDWIGRNEPLPKWKIKYQSSKWDLTSSKQGTTVQWKKKILIPSSS